MDQIDLRNLRNSYSRQKLDETQVDPDPFIQFGVWMKEAIKAEIQEPTAMTLATAAKEGIPSARTVLLKGADHNGFTFFTNYNSRKSVELAANPLACLLFYWKELERQVKIEGRVEKMPFTESNEYFASRPFESRIGAWASEQSEVIPNRKYLEDKFKEYSEKFADGNVPIPIYWGGFRLIPASFEFWQGRESRLHDRILYTKTESGWIISRLAP